jgi:hypothetical protein
VAAYRSGASVRVNGYCTSCHRYRRVSARDMDMALALMRRGIVAGVCDDCAAEAEED